jgi:hypothetical protein
MCGSSNARILWRSVGGCLVRDPSMDHEIPISFMMNTNF